MQERGVGFGGVFQAEGRFGEANGSRPVLLRCYIVWLSFKAGIDRTL